MKEKIKYWYNSVRYNIMRFWFKLTRQYEMTEKGEQILEYLYKVCTDGYEPKTYAEQSYEKILQQFMETEGIPDRCEAARIFGITLSMFE